MSKLIGSLILMSVVTFGGCSTAVTDATKNAAANNTKSLIIVKAELVPLVKLFQATLLRAENRGLMEVLPEDPNDPGLEKAYVLSKSLVDELLIFLGKQTVGAKEYESRFLMWDSRLGAYIIRSKAIEAGVSGDKSFTVGE